MPSRSHHLVVATTVLGALVLLAIFASQFVLLELLVRRLGLPLLLALGTGFAIVGCGRIVLVALRYATSGERNDLERDPAFAFVIGHSFFGLIAFFISLIAANPWTLGLLLFATIAGGAVLWRRIEVVPQSAEPEVPAELRHVSVVLVVIAGAVAALMAQLPPVALDDVAYHLAVPKIWLLEGLAIELPLMSHSYFPLGIESADLPLLSLLGNDGGVASHFLHLLSALATGSLIMKWLRSAAPSLAWPFAAAIATTPALLLTAGWSGNDVPLLGASVALLLALDGSAPRGAIAAAVAAGLLIKYSFLGVAGLLIVAAALARAERRSIILSSLVGAVVGSPFFIRNLVLTGNPFAPLFSETGNQVASFRSGSSIARYVFDGQLVDDSLGVGLLLFFLTGLMLLITPRRAFRYVALAAMILGTIGLLVVSPAGRILLPFLVVIALLVAAELPAMTMMQTRLVGLTAVVLAALQLLVAGLYLDRLDTLALLGGRALPAEYVSRQRAVQPAIDWANGALPAQSRTLVLGVQELFWFDHRVRGAGNFDSDRIESLLHGSPDDVYRSVKTLNISHVAVFKDGITAGPQADRKRQQRMLQLSPGAIATLEGFLRQHTRAVASKGPWAIFDLQ